MSGTKYAWAAPLWRRLYLKVHFPIWRLATRIRYIVTGQCGNACGYAQPYGWVPEAGCAVHDNEKLIAAWAESTIEEIKRLQEEIETMRVFNTLLVGQPSIWIPCTDCQDRRLSRYFNHETQEEETEDDQKT